MDLNLKSSYQIASLLYMHIDMGGRIAGRQDRPSLIFEGPPWALKYTSMYEMCTSLLTPVYSFRETGGYILRLRATDEAS